MKKGTNLGDESWFMQCTGRTTVRVGYGTIFGRYFSPLLRKLVHQRVNLTSSRKTLKDGIHCRFITS
jgi:hypothetical protein